MHNKHLTKITKIFKYKKLNSTPTTEHKTEHNYTLVNQAIKIHKSKNKEVTKEIEHISNDKRQRFKGRKTQERKMKNKKYSSIITKVTIQNKTNNAKTKKYY